MSTIRILDYEIAVFSLEQATDWCLEATRHPEPKTLVTLNPEIIVQAQQHQQLKEALQAADLTVADGIGVLWAAKRFGYRLPERVPGVELTARLLERGAQNLRVFFLGAKPGIAEWAATEAHRRYQTVIAGSHHGYFKRPEETPKILELISSSKAHLLLAGLGEGQELFLHQHRHELSIPLMIGVGGTLDVLAGEVQRTPAWTRQLGLEWAYRVGSDPKRWHRFPRLLQFMRLVLAQARSEKLS